MGLYILPVETVGSRRAPKYLKSWINDSGMGVTWNAIDFGGEPWALVRADTDATQHTTLTANSDVSAIPTNLDALLTAGQVTAIETKLETMNMPGDWVNTSFTSREVLRIVVGMAQFAQHYEALGGGRVFDVGISLSTQFNQLSAPVRSRLIQCANDMKYNTSGLSGTSTLRQIFKNLGDQWGNKKIILGSLVI